MENRADLKSLCEVCRRLYNICAPLLYESLVISTTELSLEKLVTTIKSLPTSLLCNTRHLRITAPIHYRLESRCVHHDDPRLTDEAVERRVDNSEEVEDVRAARSGRDGMVLIICLAVDRAGPFFQPDVRVG